jgi:hypothetical protein
MNSLRELEIQLATLRHQQETLEEQISEHREEILNDLVEFIVSSEQRLREVVTEMNGVAEGFGLTLVLRRKRQYQADDTGE